MSDLGTPERPSNQLEAEFWHFHAHNPEVYGLFCHFAGRLVKRGFEHHSADAVLHRIRWETAVETSHLGYKINNDFSAYYARLWMRLHPEHDGFFRTRKIREAA